MVIMVVFEDVAKIECSVYSVVSVISVVDVVNVVVVEAVGEGWDALLWLRLRLS